MKELPGTMRTGQSTGRTGEKLIGILILGCLLLNFPFLSLFGGDRTIIGFPLLFSYIFLAWGLIIAGVALVLRNRPPATPEKPEDK